MSSNFIFKQPPNRTTVWYTSCGSNQKVLIPKLNRSIEFFYRQQQVLAREIGWQRRVADEEHAKQQAVDLRRRQVEAQLAKENVCYFAFINCV